MTREPLRHQRGPYAKTTARRAEILAAARESFRTNGYRGSSFRQIAERVGLSQAGILHHFGSKAELLIAVLEQRDLDHLVSSGEPRGVERLHALRAILTQVHDDPGTTQLFTTLSAEATNPEHPAREFFEGRYVRVRREFETAFAEAVEDGLPLRLSPAAAAVLLAAVMDGIQLQWLLEPDLDIRTVFDDFLRLLFEPPYDPVNP